MELVVYGRGPAVFTDSHVPYRLV